MPIQKRKTGNSFGLTQSQNSILAGQRLSPDSPLYNMVYTFHFKGEIDTNRFRKAFGELINRSQAMRIIFGYDNTTPVQTILAEMEYDLEIIDWSDRNIPESSLNEWIDGRSRRGLDISRCTFDSALIKLSNSNFLWYLNQHHLVTDARSNSLIFDKMAELYSKSAKADFEEARHFPNFSNYLEYEKAAREDSKRIPVSEYWDEKGKAIYPPLNLYGRSKSSTTESRRVSIDLGIERTHSLKALTKDREFRAFTEDLSLFNIFLTMLVAYLHRISGQKDITLGSPVHNRTTNDFKNSPGLFVEFFPYSCSVGKDETFTSLFKRVSTETLNFLRNAQPGASTPSSNRIFNVVFNYIKTNFPDFNEIPSEAIWHHPNHSDTHHHMRLHVYNDSKAESLKLFFDFNCDIFRKATRKTAPGHFLNLLDAFLEDRDQCIAEIPLLSKLEFQSLVAGFNEHSSEATGDVLELFRNQVRARPQSIVVSDKEEILTYEELDRKSDQLAAYLLEKHISSGDRVAIVLKRSTNLIIGILASLKAGCSYIPVATENPRERVIERIAFSECSIVLTSGELASDLRELSVPVIQLTENWDAFSEAGPPRTDIEINSESIAYVMFTSGSSGTPKGVKISHQALGNYVKFAGEKYVGNKRFTFPLFTTIDFDLTVTSIFVPLTTGGKIEIYSESETGPDLAILDVIEDNKSDVIKLTPSHLSLLRDRDLRESRIQVMIVGGEDLKKELAHLTKASFGKNLEIYNEYGPTEATVGCVLHRFNEIDDASDSVPIGKPIPGAKVYILDNTLNPVPRGAKGKLYISGAGLSAGYLNNSVLTKKSFISNPFESGTKMYSTGDLARLNSNDQLEFLGRIDDQVKIGGVRTELGEIESALASYPGIENCSVELLDTKADTIAATVSNCTRCGLPSNYPSSVFDENGICNLCSSFKNYQERVSGYFKTRQDLKKLFDQSEHIRQSTYDCLLLLSGGKDSTYALAQLVSMGVRVFAFTLDNGYLSSEAKANITRVVKELGVDHTFAKTPAMNKIFVDSLERNQNVCNGCFKTIYTLSMKYALENDIPFIVTGLSRGQFFETRLTEELFWKDDLEAIDQSILQARKSYHRADDAVRRYLDTAFLENDTVFDKVKFIDFYRYFDVEFDEIMKYLDEHLPWTRPTDTGRSTNCLINQVGIYVHKKEKGYSNYAFPYSWDVRMGHKTRETSIDEINEEIDTTHVEQIMREIGYSPREEDRSKKLVSFYVANEDISQTKLRNHLAKRLPAYMIPVFFRRLEKMPLTNNGKIDRKALRKLDADHFGADAAFQAPATEFEKILSNIWSKVLQIDEISTTDNFLEIGGNSLSAIRIMTRANRAFQLDLPLTKIFEEPTIKNLSVFAEKTILEKLSAGTETEFSG